MLQKLSGLFLFFLLALPGHANVGESGDFEPANTGWNGFSRFIGILTQEGYNYTVEDQLDWDEADLNDIFLFVHPTRKGESAPNSGLVADFLRRGGKVILADDFGAAKDSLASLGLTQVTELPPKLDAYQENPALPFAEPVPGHSLGRGIDLLLSNHPSAFHSELTPAFVFGNPPANADPDPSLYSLVVEGGLEEGRIIAIADPSIFINSMLDYPGNETFVRNLLFKMAGPPPGQGKFRIFVNSFAEWGRGGGPPPLDSISSLTAIQDFLEQFNDWLGELSLYAPKGELARLMAALLVLAAFLALLARMAQTPIRYDGHWLGAKEDLRPGLLTPEEVYVDSNLTEETLLDTFRIAVEDFLRESESEFQAFFAKDRSAERRLQHLLSQIRALPLRKIRPGRLSRFYKDWESLLKEANLLELWKRRARG